jgi:hypothetical protein
MLAVEKVKGEIDERSPLWRDLEERGDKAVVEFNGTVAASLTRLWYPTGTGLESARLALAFTDQGIDGEEQIERLLSSEEVRELYLAVEPDCASAPRTSSLGAASRT